jgi:PKD repeat protein
MDEATYAEADGTDGVNDDHPIAWCKRYHGGRMFYTGLAHTEASWVEQNFLRHFLGGLEVAAGVTADADCRVPPNAVPTVSATRNPSGIVDAGEPVAFTATAADADNDALSYAWEFGDGGTSTEANPTHTYTTLGAYTAKVTVSDGRGGTATATLPVTVAAASSDTPGSAGGDVELLLSLSIAGPATFSTLVPGVANDYSTSVSAVVTSTAGEATLTVADPSSTLPGRLVNGDYALESPLQLRATTPPTRARRSPRSRARR